MDRLDCSLGLDTSRPQSMEEFCVQWCDRNTVLYRPLHNGDTVQGRTIQLTCFQEG